MTILVSDDFNRAGLNSGGPATYTAVNGSWDIWTSDRLRLAGGHSGLGSIRCDTDLGSDDNWAQITIPNVSAVGGGSHGVAARYSASAETYYAWLWRGSQNRFCFFRVVAGVATVMNNGTITGESDGDIFGLEVEGTTLRGFKNGVAAGSQTDSNITTGRHGGVTAGASNAGAGQFDDFQVGDFGDGEPEEIEGTLTATLEDATLSATGALKIKGALSVTLEDAVLSAAGNSAVNTEGVLSVTLESATLSSAGKLALKAALTATLADATLSSAGKLTIAGTLTATLADATLSSTGKLANRGVVSVTLAGATLSASGRDPNAEVNDAVADVVMRNRRRRWS